MKYQNKVKIVGKRWVCSTLCFGKKPSKVTYCFISLLNSAFNFLLHVYV